MQLCRGEDMFDNIRNSVCGLSLVRSTTFFMAFATFCLLFASNSAQASTYSISGRISGDVNGGATVTLSGAATDTTTSDGSGNYSFTGLADGSLVEVGKVGAGSDIWVFFGNVYVLLPNSITKFIPVEGGYAEGSEYLNSPQSFSDKSHLAIDASIWVTSGSEILKFTRGDRGSFGISGLVSEVGEFSLIYTDANLQNLYVVDSTNSALLIISTLCAKLWILPQSAAPPR